jgi:hypothetical protein
VKVCRTLRWRCHSNIDLDFEFSLQFGLYDRPGLRSWHKGRILLLGDAAHPIPPVCQNLPQPKTDNGSHASPDKDMAMGLIQSETIPLCRIFTTKTVRMHAPASLVGLFFQGSAVYCTVWDEAATTTTTTILLCVWVRKQTFVPFMAYS